MQMPLFDEQRQSPMHGPVVSLLNICSAPVSDQLASASLAVTETPLPPPQPPYEYVKRTKL